MKNDNQLKQDLNQEAIAGGPFIIQLLFDKPCAMPQRDIMNQIMQKHLGDVENFSYDEKGAGFAVKKYKAEFKDASIPPQLMITDCCEFDGSKIDVIKRSQMWNCENSEEILATCKYQVVATDMLAAALHYKERAELDMDFLEALVEMYPDCKAVYFGNSSKMFTADEIRNHQIPREDRFVYFAVNVRFFNIQGTDDMLVDSLGMYTLFMPDIQYHFHSVDPNFVVNHAYNVLSYMFANENPIKSGDPIDSVSSNGSMCREIMWKCNYENALIQPVREVIDIYMNEYAAGTR